jgi:hypothetical protein
MRKVSLPISGHVRVARPSHLLVENTAVDAPDEDKVFNARNVNPGREEIDRNGDLGQGVVTVRADEIAHSVHTAGDLADSRVLNLAVCGSEGLFQLGHHDVSVRIAHSENQRFAGQVRVNVSRQFVRYDPVKRLRDDILVELIHFETDFVGRRGEVYHPGTRIDQLNLFALLELDTGLAEGGRDLDWRLVIDEIAVDHRFAIGILEYGFAEYADRVQCGCRCQADLDRVKVFQHTTVFRDVVILTAEAKLSIRHLTIKQIAAMTLIDHHQVILIDGRHVRRVVVV